MVSTGLAALGYKYINLGKKQLKQLLLLYLFFILLMRVYLVNSHIKYFAR